MKTILILLCTLPLQDAYKWHPWDYDEYMYNSDRDMIIQMCSEILQDSKLLVRQTYFIKKEHKARIPFQIGLVMGKLRERYKRIMDAYKEKRDRYNKRNMLFGPGQRDMRPIHYVLTMEAIKGVEVEIDKMIHVLEKIPDSAFSIENAKLPTLPGGVGRSGTREETPPSESDVNPVKPDVGRSGTREEKPPSQARDNPVKPDTVAKPSNSTGKFRTENELKLHYRKEYEKNNGLQGKEWSLDHYYGFA